MLVITQAAEIQRKNYKFKALVHKIMGKIQIEKMKNFSSELKGVDPGKVHLALRLKDEFMQRTTNYRKNIDKLEKVIIMIKFQKSMYTSLLILKKQDK